jgi:hypothetical protein
MRKRTAIFILLVVAPLVAVAISSMFLFRPAGGVLEVEMRAIGGSFAQIFWSDTYAMNGNDTSIVLLHQHPGDFERVRFSLPSRPLEVLRFDPIDGPGEVIIRSMRVLDYEGRILRTIDPLVMVPLNQIALFVPDGTGARIVTTPKANDPMMVMRSSWLAAPPRRYSLQFVTPFSLIWVTLAAAAVIAVGVGIVARDLMRGPLTARDGLWLAALFLGVVWATVTLLHRYPVPVPFWDQWDGEAITLYIPSPYNGVTWRQMFALHNEHRIFFSRLLALALVKSNGEWDPHLQIVVNSVLHALGATVLAAVLWLSSGRRLLPIIALVVGLAYAAPFALENSLSGFQSSFYFLILFSMLALWLVGTLRPGTPAWWVGAFCALCCPFTVAGGTAVAVPIGSLVVLDVIGTGKAWRQTLTTLSLVGVILGLGYAALPPPIPYHEALKANSIAAFFVSLGRNLAFPWINQQGIGPVVWLPIVALTAAVIVRRLHTTTFERVALSLGAWVMLQAIVIARSRGAAGISPASRYLDMLSLGFVANTVALAALLDVAHGRTWRRIGYAAVAGWLLAGALGIASLSQEMVRGLARDRRQWTRHHIKNVREFEQTGDVKAFLELRAPQEIPYHSAAMLAGWLQNPEVRRILPPAVRNPLSLHPAEDGSEASATDSMRAWDGVPPVFDSYDHNPASGPMRFESQPITCKEFEHLRFEVASSASWSGLRLSLHRVDSGEERPIRPPKGAKGWNSVFVHCPDGPFTVIASDDSSTNWLAVREPTEIGPGSMLAERLIGHAEGFGWLVLGLAAGALMLTLSAGAGGGRQEARGQKLEARS